MKKVLKSPGAKIFASLLMSFMLVVFVVSSIGAVTLYKIYRDTRKTPTQIVDAIKEEEVQRIIGNYYNELFSYYFEELEGYEKWDNVKDSYTENNCNMAFRLEPVGENSYNLPVFENYEMPAYMQGYTYTRTSGINTVPNTVKKVFTYTISADTYKNCVRNDIMIVEEHDGNGGDYYIYRLKQGEFQDDGTSHTYVIDDNNTNSSYCYEGNYDDLVENGFPADVTEEVSDDYTVAEFDLSRGIFPYNEIYYEFYYGLKPGYNEFDISDGTPYTYAYSNDVNEKDNYVASNGIHAFYDEKSGKCIYLDMDEEFCEQYNTFFREIEGKYDYWSCVEKYNSATGTYTVEVLCDEVFDVQFSACVKKDNLFSAHDDFYYSPILRYADFMVKADIPLLIISTLLLLLLTVYIIAFAGRVNKSDELHLSVLDKFPYELVLLPLGALVCNWLYVLSSWSSLSRYNWEIVIATGVVAALIIPVIFFTTVTRIKAKTILKNTIIYRLLHILFKSMKKCSKSVSGAFSVLWNNINIYGKYVGVFLAVALLEFICIVGSSLPFFGITWIFEKLVFSIILVVACINMNKLKKAGSEIAKGNMDYELNTQNMLGEFKAHGDNLNSIRNGMSNAVAESLKSERMKTELITNVSHDIKTPLTSIINYVDLLEKENIDNEKAKEYIEVLNRQSARLKKLIQDLIDASKASTGNIDVTLEKTDVNVVINQALGEFTDKLEARGIKTITKSDREECFAIADARLLWRVMENLINNIVKYAQENSRVYIDVVHRDQRVSITFKNISKEELNISGDELMERFVRGDSSRNTEGSGLGLSIARSLVELQNGQMEIIVDGDLFKVVLLLIVG